MIFPWYHFFVYYYCLLYFLNDISSSRKYPADNCMFGVGDGDTGAGCGVCFRLAIKTPERRHWRHSWLWPWVVPCSGVPVVDFGQRNIAWALVILMTRFLLTNDILHWLIHFAVILLRLFFTVNITNFNKYSIYSMKLQVFMVLWSVLKSPLVLGSSFAAISSQFLWIPGWLASFCMVRVFGWWGFWNRL